MALDELPKLKPCPFCGEQLRHIRSEAKSFDRPRIYHEYHHPQNGCIVQRGGGSWYTQDDHQRRLNFITSWNTRAVGVEVERRLEGMFDEPMAEYIQTPPGDRFEACYATMMKYADTLADQVIANEMRHLDFEGAIREELMSNFYIDMDKNYFIDLAMDRLVQRLVDAPVEMP